MVKIKLLLAMLRITVILIIYISFIGSAMAQYDESKVPSYILPEILETKNGKVINSVMDWEAVRRPEILDLFSKHVYGVTPKEKLNLRFEVLESDRSALGGTAIRKQIRIHFANSTSQYMDLLIYLPVHTSGKVPLFLGLNFAGNQTIIDDKSILMSEKWVPDWEDNGIVNNKGTLESRGKRARRWPVAEILSRGYGLATVYYGDLHEDRPEGVDLSVKAVFAKNNITKRDTATWGAIGTWAWGLSRAMDYLVTDPDIDAKKIGVLGHSRLGKASLWAGAQDTRFAIVVSNCSGEGGAAITRRKYGETIKVINTRFPHWFAANYKEYNDKENELPVDFHMLLALMAPRPVYVASASEDRWADPKGEYVSAYKAGEAYNLYGLSTLVDPNPPLPETPVGARKSIGYHMRIGKHDILSYDWQQYMNFADYHFKKK